MIIRKPYAFLIKHFKMIHLFIFICVLYVAYNTTALFNFFNGYVVNGYYSYVDNLAGSLINFYVYAAIIVIVLLGIIIYVLLRWKDKKRTLYVFMCCFYIALFVVYVIYFGLLTVIENSILDVRVLRTYRDIVFLFNFPQYFFIVIAFIRTVGFDIKKFDFKKDMEELDIAAPDDEEIEISFGRDNYKLKRKFRRSLREFKYYALENKFFFGFICTLLFLSFIFAIYLNFDVYNKKYSETDLFNIDGVNFKVLSSYTSDVDYKGDYIIADKEYIVVLVSMINNSDERKVLKTENLKLIADGEEFSINYSKNNYFIDLGEGYYNQTLYPGEEKEYVFVYEIPKDKIDTSYIFRMRSDVNYSNGEIKSNHRDVIIKPVFYNKNYKIYNLNLGSLVDLKTTTLTGMSAIVMSYEFKDSYTVNYNYCVFDKCYIGEKVLKPDIVGKIPKTIMKLEVDFDNNESLYINKYLKDNEDLISMFGKLIYKVGGVTKTTSIETFDYEYLNGREVYAQVPSEILDATSIILNITVRNFVFNITLK